MVAGNEGRRHETASPPRPPQSLRQVGLAARRSDHRRGADNTIELK